MTMFTSQLKINTSLSAPPSQFISPSPRSRTFSNTSSTSSLSVLSPPPSSSTNASSTSLVSPDIPSNPVSPFADEAADPMPEYVLAMHDYDPQHNVDTCLAFRAGQVIHVLNRDSSGWWDGELEGSRGWFPSNYVNADVNPLVDADDDNNDPSYSASQLASSSYTNPDLSSHVPPVMVPLLHGMSLLQSAARSSRISHFQPSTACIISCVRNVLSATDTLIREAPILRQFPVLADERRLVLSTLASLVAQAKRASADDLDDFTRDAEVDEMLRRAQQVFDWVRRFVALACQCGVDLPTRRDSGNNVVKVTVLRDTDLNGVADDNDTTVIQHTVPTASPPGKTPTKRHNVKSRPATPGTVTRAKSMSDFRSRGKAGVKRAPVPPPPLPSTRSFSVNGHRPVDSVASTSSASSISSLGSVFPPSQPPFPHGPCTMAEVLQALRTTHDHYLSAVAAFVGHAHSHSRFSHASSMGHMYELIREIVDMSCRLLSIVEAVLQHPDIPSHRLGSLRAAKEQLYNVTSELAESVRLLTIPLPQAMSDEEEKKVLLRSATAALKAGGDLVFSIKVCLNRSVGNKPFMINVPLGEPGPSSASGSLHARSASASFLQRSRSSSRKLPAMKNGIEELVDEDVTIQARSDPPILIRSATSSGSESSRASQSSSAASGETHITTPSERKIPSPLIISRAVFEPPLVSPVSVIKTDDGTTWEGSTRGHHQLSLEEKVVYGNLPDIPPPEPSAPIPTSVKGPTRFLFSHDYAAEDIAYNSEGTLVGATLSVLVEKLTPHDSIVDAAFSAVFFMTFRLFGTPIEVADTLIARYNLLPPPGLPEEDFALWQQQKGLAVRLRVSNFIKTWLEIYWRSVPDNTALYILEPFTRAELVPVFPGPAERILEMISRRREQSDSGNGISPIGDRTRDPGMSLNPPSIPLPSEIPRPLMTKPLFSALKSRNFGTISVTDFDPLELARQMTIMESKLYARITPEEILESGQDSGVKSSPPVNVKEMSSLSTAITGWVAESILNERDTKKRTALVKFFIKVADRCVGLHNYSTFRSLLAALDSSTISRLHQTWLGLTQKSKHQLESLRKLADHGRNYHEYRSKLRNTAPPAVPFLGLYLTDVTFCREGNPSHRNSPVNPDKKLLNFNKYHKLARIVQDMQRFQTPYNLKDIPEVQEYLAHAFKASQKKGDLQDLYRRSLLVEPKQPADAPPSGPSGDMRQLFNWASRDRSQAQQAQVVAPV